MCHNAHNCEYLKQEQTFFLKLTFLFSTPNSQKNCNIIQESGYFFWTIFLRYVNVCTETIYQIETSKEIRSRKRADIINLDKLPLNLVDIGVSQWSTGIPEILIRRPKYGNVALLSHVTCGRHDDVSVQ